MCVVLHRIGTPRCCNFSSWSSTLTETVWTTGSRRTLFQYLVCLKCLRSTNKWDGLASFAVWELQHCCEVLGSNYYNLPLAAPLWRPRHCTPDVRQLPPGTIEKEELLNFFSYIPAGADDGQRLVKLSCSQMHSRLLWKIPVPVRMLWICECPKLELDLLHRHCSTACFDFSPLPELFHCVKKDSTTLSNFQMFKFLDM